MSDFIERLRIEKQELDDKIGNLKAFMEGDEFKLLDRVQQSLMQVQSHAMLTYSQILFARIERLNRDLEMYAKYPKATATDS